jgi:hypothetical protein
MIIAQNPKKDKLEYWLYFSIIGDSIAWYHKGLPPPNFMTSKRNLLGEKITNWGWLLDGYFHTRKGREYLNDVIARFLISFRDLKIQRLEHKPPKDIIILARAYKLKELSKNLDSMPSMNKAQRADIHHDNAFWAIKLYAEDEIKATGFIVYERLEHFALRNFEHKELSTIRAKCRSVWNYYNDRNFKINLYEKKPKEEVLATRIEHQKYLTKLKIEETTAKILSSITYLKAKQSKITAKAICEHSGLSKNTLTKYKHLWKGDKK